MSYLIELKGERQLVESLDGYDGWTVVEKGVDLPPSDHCTRVKGKWVEDAFAKALAEQAAELAAMSRVDMVTMIEGLIATQAARVDSLQTQVEAAVPVSGVVA